MDMTLETSSAYRSFIYFLIILVMGASCASENPEALSFYYPKRSLSGHAIPVIATNPNAPVLEGEMTFDFLQKQYKENFRFRMAYFDLEDESTSVKQEAITINQTHVSDTLVLKKDQIYELTHPLYIDSNAVFIMEEGAQLYIADAVDIINKGKVTFTGNQENPVLLDALHQNWGGIQSYSGEMHLEHVIITHFGGNDSIKVRHSYSQPAIYMVENGVFNASNLFIINGLGKAMYINGSVVSIERSLFADCDTGPEINWSKVDLDSIICMNIPDAKDGEDDDNDALYIFGRHKNYPDSPPKISHALLGFAKDDGFDHGKNDMQVNDLLVYNVKDKAISLEGGHMNIRNMWLSDARVLIGVKQDTHAMIDSVYLGEGERTDILENMQQDPTLDIENEFTVDGNEAEAFWFSIY